MCAKKFTRGMEMVAVFAVIVFIGLPILCGLMIQAGMREQP